MYFGLSEEQQFFKDNVNKFLNDHASLDIVKKLLTTMIWTSKMKLLMAY